MATFYQKEISRIKSYIEGIFASDKDRLIDICKSVVAESALVLTFNTETQLWSAQLAEWVYLLSSAGTGWVMIFPESRLMKTTETIEIDNQSYDIASLVKVQARSNILQRCEEPPVDVVPLNSLTIHFYPFNSLIMAHLHPRRKFNSRDDLLKWCIENPLKSNHHEPAYWTRGNTWIIKKNFLYLY